MEDYTTLSDICHICKVEPTEPVECQVCKSSFCLFCAKWRKAIKDQCPLRCHSGPWKIDLISRELNKLEQQSLDDENELNIGGIWSQITYDQDTLQLNDKREGNRENANKRVSIDQERSIFDSTILQVESFQEIHDKHIGLEGCIQFIDTTLFHQQYKLRYFDSGIYLNKKSIIYNNLNIVKEKQQIAKESD